MKKGNVLENYKTNKQNQNLTFSGSFKVVTMEETGTTFKLFSA